ncbi:hypothetical protein ACYSUO_24555 [Streptomyces sp. UC4497]
MTGTDDRPTRMQDRLWRAVKEWLTPADAKETAARAKELALSVLPPGEGAEPSAAHLVQVDSQVPQPPARLRPNAFDGSPGLLTRAGEIDDRLFRLNPVNALVRGGKEREAMRGDWESLAGLLVRALVPRKLENPGHVLVAGAGAYHLVRVEGRIARGEVGPRAELAWSLPRPALAWVRSRNDIKHNTHELGFADGSWTTALFTSDGAHAVGRTFPQRLPYSAPRPGT